MNRTTLYRRALSTALGFALAVIGLGLPAHAGDGDKSLSASLSEEDRRLVSLSYDGEVLDTDEVVDLGFIAPGDRKSFDFVLRNERPTNIRLPPDFVEVEGLELELMSAVPPMLAPGEEVKVVLRTTGKGNGDTVRREIVLRKGSRALMKARLELAALSPGHAEERVREIYGRYQTFAAAAKQPIAIDLGSFRTYYGPELDSVKYLQLFDWLQVERIEMSVRSTGRSDRDAVAMEPAWVARDSMAVESEQEFVEQFSETTVGDFYEYSQYANPWPELLAATSFQVSVELQGQAQTYRAAVFWANDSGTIAIADRVLIDLDRVWQEKRLPADEALVEGRSELSQSPPSGTTSKSGSQCQAENQVSVTTKTEFGDQNHLTGSHSSHLQMRWVCNQRSNCTTICSGAPTPPLGRQCNEEGIARLWTEIVVPGPPYVVDVVIPLDHRVYEEWQGDPEEPGRNCTAHYGCAVRECVAGLCFNDVSLEFGIQGGGQNGGGTIGVVVDPDETIDYHELSITSAQQCAEPTQCPQGGCDGSGSVSFDLEFEESGNPPVVLTADIDVTLTAGNQRMTVGAADTYTFPELVPSGTGFSVLATSSEMGVFCTVDNGTDRVMEGSDISDIAVSCRKFVLPQGCPYNPIDCIPPPSSCYEVPAYIDTIHVHTTNSIEYEIDVDGETTYGTATDVHVASYDVWRYELICSNAVSGASPDLDKAATTTLGPILYGRNRPLQPVSGDVVIHGVARDDGYGVADVEVYLDGAAAPLQGFQFNIDDGLTCDEYPSANCDRTSTFAGILDTSGLSAGSHSLIINATNHAGVSNAIQTQILVGDPSPPNVELVASYMPEGGSQRVTYRSDSASAQTPLRFRYDPSQGHFGERIGGSCGQGVDNPTYFKIRLEGDPNFTIDSCQWRGFFDSSWHQCSQGLVDAVNDRRYSVIGTDSHNYSNCDFGNPGAPYLGSEEPVAFRVRFVRDGLVYERRVDLVKVD